MRLTVPNAARGGRGRSTRLSTLLCLPVALISLLAVPSAAAEPAWETVATGAVTVKARPRPGSAVFEIWAEADLDAPVKDIQDTLTTMDRFHNFMPYVKTAKEVSREEDGSVYTYTELGLPVISDRDYVVHVWLDEGVKPDGSGAYRCHWEAAPDKLPAKDSLVRVKVNEGHWDVSPKDDGKSHVVYRFRGRPRRHAAGVGRELWQPPRSQRHARGDREGSPAPSEGARRGRTKGRAGHREGTVSAVVNALRPKRGASIIPGMAELAQMRPPISIERARARDMSYAEFLDRYLRQNRPLVIEGAADAWPAIEKWRPEFFKQRFGAMPVHIGYEKQMPFDAFIDAVNASSPERPGPYMYRLFIVDVLPELLTDLMPGNDFGFPRRLASPLMPSRWRRPDGYLKLLIGGPGGKFPVMHFDGDNMHAAITEIHGDKEALLFSPEDGPYMYPRPDRPNQSLIENLVKPDLTTYPLLARAQPYMTVIKPSETLFVPSRWWHTTRVLSPSVSVCTNTLDASNWPGFVDEVCKQTASPARRMAKRAALKLLGRTLDGLERAQVSGLEQPAGRLSPTRSALARDLREWRPPAYDGAPPY